jgi:hypothetical protein
MATEHGVLIAAARKCAHQEISERRKVPKKYPNPTREEVVHYLIDFAKRTAYRRDNPKLLTQGEKAIPEERWNGYIAAVLNEAKRYHGDPERKLPSGAEFSVWQDMPEMMKKFGAQSRCETCAKFVSPYGGKTHECKKAEVTQVEKVKTPIAPLSMTKEICAPKNNAVTISNANLDVVDDSGSNEQGYDPDNLIVGETPLADVRVGDMREWIRESHAQAYSEGLAYASAHPKKEQSTAYAMPRTLSLSDTAYVARASATRLPSTLGLHGLEIPTNMTLKERLAHQLIGVHRCTACGQFVEVGGHYCSPSPDMKETQPIPLGPIVDEFGDPLDTAVLDLEDLANTQEIPSVIQPDFSPGQKLPPEESTFNEIKEASSEIGRFISRIILSPEGWRLMAPYAFRGALILAPLVLTAGMAMAPLAIGFAIFMLISTPKWLNKKLPETQEQMNYHYNKPFWWQSGQSDNNDHQDGNGDSDPNYFDSYDGNPDTAEFYEPYQDSRVDSRF